MSIAFRARDTDDVVGSASSHVPELMRGHVFPASLGHLTSLFGARFC
jgi:hypothetical protein